MAVKKTFNFKLNDKVELSESGEVGTVVGRAHYTNCNPNYLVRYAAGDGRQVEDWWAEDALVARD
jgi:hypothetical protein